MEGDISMPTIAASSVRRLSLPEFSDPARMPSRQPVLEMPLLSMIVLPSNGAPGTAGPVRKRASAAGIAWHQTEVSTLRSASRHPQNGQG